MRFRPSKMPRGRLIVARQPHPARVKSTIPPPGSKPGTVPYRQRTSGIAEVAAWVRRQNRCSSRGSAPEPNLRRELSETANCGVTNGPVNVRLRRNQADTHGTPDTEDS